MRTGWAYRNTMRKILGSTGDNKGENKLAARTFGNVNILSGVAVLGQTKLR